MPKTLSNWGEQANKNRGPSFDPTFDQVLTQKTQILDQVLTLQHIHTYLYIYIHTYMCVVRINPAAKKAFQDRIWSPVCVQILLYSVSTCFYSGFEHVKGEKEHKDIGLRARAYRFPLLEGLWRSHPHFRFLRFVPLKRSVFGLKWLFAAHWQHEKIPKREAFLYTSGGSTSSFGALTSISRSPLSSSGFGVTRFWGAPYAL